MAKRTAIIDIGSNSVRMVIFEKTSRFAFHLLYEVKSRVRISEGMYEHAGNLQQPAIDRALAALESFLSIAQSYHVRKTLCVATSAVRDAPNRQLFLKEVKNRLGLTIKVIDGEKEGYYGGVACANLLPRTTAMTLDIGGGSTECACIKDGQVINSSSLDIGTVRLKELYFDKDDVAGATDYIDQLLEQFPVKSHTRLIGIGGTFRALSRAIMQRSDHPIQKTHGYRFSAKTLLEFGEAVLNANSTDELKALGIKKDRYDVIKPGTLILMRVLKKLGITEVITSGVGVREGVYLTDLLRHANHRFPKDFNPSLRYLQDRFIAEPAMANQLTKLTKELFTLLQPSIGVDSSYEKALLTAAKLSKVGIQLHFYSYHLHSYYLTQTALEYGYTHDEIMLISTLIRFQKSKRPSRAHRDEYDVVLPDTKTLNWLSFILSLADALLRDHARHYDFKLSLSKKVIMVEAGRSPLYLAKEAVSGLTLPRGYAIAFH